MGIPRRTLREGVGVDVLRQTKTIKKFLGDYFDCLENILQKYKIRTANIWNADKVGVQLCNLKLKFLTTRKCIRFQSPK